MAVLLLMVEIPANQLIGSLSHSLQRFYASQCGDHRISEPSTVACLPFWTRFFPPPILHLKMPQGLVAPPNKNAESLGFILPRIDTKVGSCS